MMPCTSISNSLSVRDKCSSCHLETEYVVQRRSSPPLDAFKMVKKRYYGLWIILLDKKNKIKRKYNFRCPMASNADTLPYHSGHPAGSYPAPLESGPLLSACHPCPPPHRT